MILCQCTGTTDRDIARLQAEGHSTARAVAAAVGAGRNCAACRREIHRLLAESPTECAGDSVAVV
jgi:bacterioferritin-associated ferredoxin